MTERRVSCLTHYFFLADRDVKPLNVLLNGNVSGGQFEVKVTDFGVATEYTQEEGGLRTAETGTYRWMVSVDRLRQMHIS